MNERKEKKERHLNLVNLRKRTANAEILHRVSPIDIGPECFQIITGKTSEISLRDASILVSSINNSN